MNDKDRAYDAAEADGFSRYRETGKTFDRLIFGIPEIAWIS